MYWVIRRFLGKDEKSNFGFPCFFSFIGRKIDLKKKLPERLSRDIYTVYRNDVVSFAKYH